VKANTIFMTNTNNSTGPRTDAGKQTSSRNAIKHGCCSNETLILAAAGETIQQFEALQATWFQGYLLVKDELEIHLLNQAIQADWFLQRSNRTLAQIEADIFNSGLSPLHWDDRQHHAIQRFTRYQTARRNEFNRAKKALDDHRKMKAAIGAQAERSYITRERLRVYQEKNKPAQTFEEDFAELQQIADRLGIKSTAPNLK
jgi:hypothetical protein